MTTIKLAMTMLLLIIARGGYAQTKGVLLNAENHQPIAYANLIARTGKQVNATSSDQNGHYEVNFPYKSLTISHVGYEKLNISHLSDTIWLKPKENLIEEVEVKQQEEPQWIREKLKKFIKLREKNYQQKDRMMHYDFQNQNIGDSAGYSFECHGVMYIPSMSNLQHDSAYQISPQKAIVHYKDSAGVDFENLDKMLYEGLTMTMDSHFLRQHRFQINDEYTSTDKNIVQLVFWTNLFDKDKGTITLDTARCIVKEIHRQMGKEYIQKEVLNGFVMSLLKTFLALNISDYQITTYEQYADNEGVLCPSEFTYWNYRRFSAKQKPHGGKFQLITEFDSRETSLKLTPTLEKPERPLIDISKPKSIVIENGKGRRSRMRNALINIQKEIAEF
ncbi:MAG: hypothetical protein LKG25_01815 [Prevotella sp.]|jgi:hypothetical protein|nr:hypothetical protein [Prevotella sp.]MCI1281315.1 hypothetical protein [Prevotella sp.]